MLLLKSYVKEESPSPLKGESDRPSVCTCSGCQCTSASRNLRATVQKEATVLVLRIKQAAAIFFCCQSTDMATSFYAHTEVCYAGQKMCTYM